MVFLWGGMIAALYYWVWGAGRAPSTGRTVAKTLALGLPLIGLALMGWPVAALVGLGACVLGDAFLSRDGEAMLRAGIAAFALGHICYVVAMIFAWEDAALWDAAARIGVVTLIGIGASVPIWLLPRAGDLRGPVAGYVLLILSMGLLAMVHPMGGVLRIGALFFVISDLILALELFVLRGGMAARLAPFAVWPTYVLGQAGIMAGFAPGQIGMGVFS